MISVPPATGWQVNTHCVPLQAPRCWWWWCHSGPTHPKPLPLMRSRTQSLHWHRNTLPWSLPLREHDDCGDPLKESSVREQRIKGSMVQTSLISKMNRLDSERTGTRLANRHVKYQTNRQDTWKMQTPNAHTHKMSTRIILPGICSIKWWTCAAPTTWFSS